MTDQAGTFERLLLVAGEALAKLGGLLNRSIVSEFITSFGMRLPNDILGQATGPLADAEAAANKITGVLAPLKSALGGSDVVAVVAAGVAVATEIASTITALRSLAGGLTQAADTVIADPADRARVAAYIGQLPRLMLQRMVLEELDRHVTASGALLAALGLGEDYIDRGSRADLRLPPYRVRRLYLDRIAKLASDPQAHFRDAFGWGQPDFDGVAWFARVARWRALRNKYALLFDENSMPPSVPPALSLGFFALQSDPSVSPPGLSVVARSGIDFDYDEEFPLGAFVADEEAEAVDPSWLAYMSSKSKFEAAFRGTLAPDGRFIASLSGVPKLSVRAGVKRQASDDAPITLLGVAGGTKLEARSIDIAVGIEGLQANPYVEAKQEGLHCILDLKGGDSFLKSISGNGQGRSDISVGATWSAAAGLKFTGSATVEIAIPAHARIGPATIETVYIISGFKDDTIPLELSASVRGELGPFKASVDRIGLEFLASFPQDGGNLGPMQFDTRFKPPNGVGLDIDGGGFSGGGFLYIDPDKGEYAGALELQFQEVIHLKAVGVLSTKLPEGGDGFSLLVVISAEFAPIQLSFGFTLLGVGGLLGVNRTALYDQLRLGVRDGSLNSVLFPKDVIANAPRIISDLKRIFPPMEGRYLIGPMAKLGWGTPTLVSLEIGIVLEIPQPGFAVLGVLRVALPGDDVAILNLQVNFLGVVDFDKKQLSFDASLFNSRLLTFTLTGDMAVRVYWGDNANFLLSAGGFHPAYTPPPLGLPPLNRLTISIFQGNPRLSAETYFAVTSNTVQFGAKVELYYGLDLVNVYGFISLDALIQFDPFHFVAEIAGMVAVRSGGHTLFSIRLDLTLEGPTPWHAHGTGSFEIGFIFTITVSANFDATFGEARNTSLPPVRVAPLMEEALNADGNWRAIADANLRQHVTTRELSVTVLSPLGALAVTQKIAPLNIPLARVGARRVDGPNVFSIVNANLGGLPVHTITEQFPAAQFLDLNDAEKLSRRSFEPFDAGVEIGGGASPRADFQRHVEVKYEVIYFRKPRQAIFFRLRSALLDILVSTSAAARSKFSATRRKPSGLGTPRVTLPTESFVVAGVDDLKPHMSDMVFASKSAAVIAMKDAVRKDPRLASKLQVVGAYEVAA